MVLVIGCDRSFDLRQSQMQGEGQTYRPVPWLSLELWRYHIQRDAAVDTDFQTDRNLSGNTHIQNSAVPLAELWWNLVGGNKNM
jgi:hypothetical protein